MDVDFYIFCGGCYRVYFTRAQTKLLHRDNLWSAHRTLLLHNRSEGGRPGGRLVRELLLLSEKIRRTKRLVLLLSEGEHFLGARGGPQPPPT